jgi:homocysteine S-methyltransferase
MGTVLHGRGVPFDHVFDAINREDPAMVAEIHRAYIDAGADIIETNSFSANRFKLARHGLESEVIALNQTAVTVARRVIEGSYKQVLLAGSVGPLGVRLAPIGRVRAREAEAAFTEQISALLGPDPMASSSQSVDLLILETITSLEEIEIAVGATRALSPDLPVVAMMTITRDDRTLLGNTPADVAGHLAKLDIDVIGVNCSSGPVQVLRLLSAFREIAPDMHLAASPNAGWPQQQEGGRVLYPATPDYFAKYAQEFVIAGASLIGGCCGTTSEHISHMRRALDAPKKPRPQFQTGRMSRAVPSMIAADRPTKLQTTLAEGIFVATVEMSPPRGIAAQRLLAGARMLKETGANFINVADNPMARMRMSAWAAAHLVQRKVGLESILHFPTRGRNLLRIQGDLLAAHALGIRNLFVVMGDPTQIGDYPEAMDDYDIVPTGLVQLIKERFNSGVDHAGQTIDQPTNFCVGCALNLEAPDPKREMKLLKKKIENGVDYVLTQPIFDTSSVQTFLDAYDGPIVPIVAGIQPLYNSGNAEFLHNEVPGIVIPDQLRDRMRSADDPQQEGVTIAQEILEELRSSIQGIYMIPVFGRYDLVADVLDLATERPQ